MSKEQVTVDQLRKRLNDYMQEADKLKQTFNFQKPTLPISPTVPELVTSSSAVTEQTTILLKQHKKSTVQVHKKFAVLIGCIFIVCICLDPFVKLLTVLKIGKVFGDNVKIYAVLSQYTRIQKFVVILMQRIFRMQLWDLEVPS